MASDQDLGVLSGLQLRRCYADNQVLNNRVWRL